MSTLSSLLVLPLNALGTEIGLPSLGSWANTFINTISQGEVNAEVLNDLQQIQDSLKQMGGELDNISSQISSFEELFQEATVSAYTNAISSIYEDIQDIAATSITTAADMSDVQNRMAAVGKTLIDGSSGILSNVNEIANLLISNPQVAPGLMNTQNDALILSNEFFSYYVGVQSIAVNYFKYYAMAQFCVNWAVALDASGLISFPEGSAWLNQIEQKISDLQAFLDTNIPGSVTSLVTALVQSNGGASVAISTSFAPGSYLQFGDEPGDNSEGWFTAPNPIVGTLSPAMDISNPTADTQYRFGLSYVFDGWVPFVVPSGSGYPTLGGAACDTSSYKIWTNKAGTFVFDFYDNMYYGQPYMDAGMSVIDQGDNLYSLTAASSYSTTDPAQMMTISVIAGTPPVWTEPVPSYMGLQVVSRDETGYWTNTGPVPGGFTSGDALAMAEFQNSLYVLWRGTNDDQAVYVQSLDPSSGTWSGLGTIPGAFSTPGWIGAAAFNDLLYVAWRGTGSDAAIYYASLDANGTWSSLATIPGAFSDTGPTLAVFNGQLTCFWQGVNGDALVYWAAMATSGSWNGAQVIDGANTSTGGIASAVFGDQLYTAWRGFGDDTAIYYSAHPDAGGNWTSLSTIPGANTDTGPALAAFGGQLLAAWQGSGGDTNVYLAGMNGAGEWTALGMVPASITTTNCAAATCGDALYFGWVWAQW